MQNATRLVEASLEQARREVMQVPDLGCRRLAITFVTPRVHKSKQERIDQHLQVFKSQLEAFRNTTIAWVFPKAVRRLQLSSEENASRDYIFPGVVMLLRPVGIY